ncbi:hypothetical protein V8G54_018912 [Vigna mungo]|uniref:Chromo domain-containing protein n=1 Tax=Vigna mungo TaxID=3915 RepID=A0AAQ3RV76_VIGMU
MSDRVEALEERLLAMEVSVRETLGEFRKLMLEEFTKLQEQYLGYFIGGLRSEIQRRVRTFNPVNRLQAMHLARDVEEKLLGEGFQHRGGVYGWKSNRDWGTGLGEKFGSGSGSSSPQESRSVTQKDNHIFGDHSPASDRNRDTKHLPYSKLMNRKAQRLCFRCGEKYHPLHKCTERQLRIVVLADDEVIASEMREEEDDCTLECGSMELFTEGEVSWDDRNRPSTLGIKGGLNGVTLGVLIDSGASHNFISPHVVAALELKVDQRKMVGLRLGYRHRVSTAGKCEKLNVQLGEFSTTAVEPTLPTKLTLEEEDKEEPEAVLAAREIPKGSNIIKQWLVEWKGRTEKETTWEGEMLLQSQFPSFSLEYKAAVLRSVRSSFVIALGSVADRGHRRSLSRRAWSRFVPVVVRLVCDHCHSGCCHRHHPHHLPRVAASGLPFFFEPQVVVGEILLGNDP